MRSFLLISLVLWGAVVASASDSDYLMRCDTTSLTSYRVHMQARNANLDGVMAVKLIDGSIKGVVVNDFGIKAFAFTISHDRKKVKLHDVMPMLNHWYIKRVLKSDLRLLFNATYSTLESSNKKTQIAVLDDGTIKMTNHKYNIVYTLGQAQGSLNQDIESNEPEIEVEDESTQ